MKLSIKSNLIGVNKHGDGVRTCGVQDTLECLDSYQEGDYSGIMLRL